MRGPVLTLGVAGTGGRGELTLLAAFPFLSAGSTERIEPPNPPCDHPHVPPSGPSRESHVSLHASSFTQNHVWSIS